MHDSTSLLMKLVWVPGPSLKVVLKDMQGRSEWNCTYNRNQVLYCDSESASTFDYIKIHDDLAAYLKIVNTTYRGDLLQPCCLRLYTTPLTRETFCSTACMQVYTILEPEQRVHAPPTRIHQARAS